MPVERVEISRSKEEGASTTPTPDPTSPITTPSTFSQMIIELRNDGPDPIPLTDLAFQYYFSGTTPPDKSTRTTTTTTKSDDDSPHSTATAATPPPLLPPASSFTASCLDFQADPFLNSCHLHMRIRALTDPQPGANYVLEVAYDPASPDATVGRHVPAIASELVKQDLVLLPGTAVRRLQSSEPALAAIQAYLATPNPTTLQNALSVSCDVIQLDPCVPFVANLRAILDMESTNLDTPLYTTTDYSYLDTPTLVREDDRRPYVRQGIVPRALATNVRITVTSGDTTTVGGATLLHGAPPGYRVCRRDELPPGVRCPATAMRSRDWQACNVQMDFCCKAPKGEILATTRPENLAMASLLAVNEVNETESTRGRIGAATSATTASRIQTTLIVSLSAVALLVVLLVVGGGGRGSVATTERKEEGEEEEEVEEGSPVS